MERFNIYTNEWEEVAPLNDHRRALAVISLPDGVYAIGGYDGSNYLNTVERYDSDENKWVMCKPMKYPRCTLSAVSSDDC